VDAVLQEWAGWQSHPAWAGSPGVDTVYLGGGTPSRLEPGAIGDLMAGLASVRGIAGDAEVTLEANPDDVTAGAAKAWRAAGVNRVSLGVQSFDPSVLHWMHRTHTVEQIRPAVEAVRAAGIGDVSLDLIFGLPAALGRDWERDLVAAFALWPEHLSLYGLTVEEHTPLGRWTARGDVAPVDDERYAAEFLIAAGALADHGFEHYEVSNAARPGRRARHNSAYWRRSPFIGLGPSAHSGLDRERRWNVRDWSAYDRLTAAHAAVVEDSEYLTDEAIALEQTYLGLRTSAGYPAARLPPDTIAAWTAAGWARHNEDGRVRLTAEGWLRLDALVASAAAVG
jgi:oxygen-independent coproporphyrinogen-3 oxidase